MKTIIGSVLLIVGISTGWAAGTVTRCNYPSLARALQGGGLVRFACSGTIRTPVGVPGIVIRENTQLDASGRSVVLRGHGGAPVLSVEGAAVEVRGLTLANGGRGGISAVGSSLALIDSLVRNNPGGGIFGFGVGRITLTHSTVRDNGGDGVDISAATALNVENSTLANNAGHALSAYEVNSVTVTNSTVSGNRADLGAGLIAYATVTVTHSTFVDNSATRGGGIYIIQGYGPGSVVTLVNSIVARNSGSDCAGTLPTNLPVDGGHNLDSDGSCHLDPAKGSLPAIDPLLGPLADNGGPTWTHAAQPGSPVIDAIADTLEISVDQRGIPRPQDGDGDGQAYSDLGAVEVQDGHCDLNGNGHFDVRDAVLFSRHCGTGKIYGSCDLDRDGRFTRKDAALFSRQCQPRSGRG